MFWADKTAEEARAQLKGKDEVIVRDEKTASGRVHVGSMRGVAIHGIVTDILNEKGITAKFLYEINDFDPMDGLPTYLDKSEYEQHMGKRLCEIPSPDGRAESLAEFYADEFKEVITGAGFSPEFYKTSELYTSGKMNDVIRQALEMAPEIRTIYKKVSGSVKPDDWMPLNVVCESCGKVGTTQVLSFDGEQVTYECKKDLVTWAKGCSHKGAISPFDGNASLPWKVEWAAKFKVVGVDVEGAGKDHSTRGGARDVANHIAREVFSYDPPFDIPYEFFLVNGKKMSSSRGAGASAREVADSLPRKIFRLALLGTKPMRAINFEPNGNTIPMLYDRYDEVAEKYWSRAGDDDSRLYELVHLHDIPDRHYLMRFSQVAFLAQMPHIDIFREAREEKGEELSEIELGELRERIDYSLAWIQKHAPDRYVFKLQQDTPTALSFSRVQKKAFEKLYTYIQANEVLTGEDLHHQLHQIKKEVAIDPQELFTGLYQAFLGRDSGPQAGWFLSVLPRDFLLQRLHSIVHTS